MGQVGRQQDTGRRDDGTDGGSCGVVGMCGMCLARTDVASVHACMHGAFAFAFGQLTPPRMEGEGESQSECVRSDFRQSQVRSGQARVDARVRRGCPGWRHMIPESSASSFPSVFRGRASVTVTTHPHTLPVSSIPPSLAAWAI